MTQTVNEELSQAEVREKPGRAEWMDLSSA